MLCLRALLVLSMVGVPGRLFGEQGKLDVPAQHSVCEAGRVGGDWYEEREMPGRGPTVSALLSNLLEMPILQSQPDLLSQNFWE